MNKETQLISYDEELFAHFEKRYFHETDRKDQLFQRLNIPLAAIFAISGFYAIILSLRLEALSTGWLVWFWVVATASLLCMIIGAYFFVDALLGGVDKVLATPQDLDEWKHQLVDHYKEEGSTHSICVAIRKNLFENYMLCTTVISINNERRANSIYRSSIFLVSAAALAVIAYAIVKFTL